MKNSPFTTILLGALLISVVASVILCWLYIGYAREFRQLQAQVVAINGRTGAIKSLLNDAIEYSKENPEIDPILQAAAVKPKPGQTNPTQPAPAKPGGK